MRNLTYPRYKAFTDTNAPASGWKVYSYKAGTTDLQDTYSDESGASPNPNPVILDGSGESDIWLDQSKSYKIVLTDENDVVQRTVYNINPTENVTVGDLTADAITADSLTASGTVTANAIAVTSTTKVDNLNASSVDGKTFPAPGPIGGTTPDTISCTTLSVSSTAEISGNVTKHGTDTIASPQAAQWIHGQLSEEITLSTSGTTTDSTANLLPANSIIEAVCARVTTTITTATDWKLGDSTQAARFCGAQATTQLTAGATVVGLSHQDPTVASANLGPVQTTAAKLRITTTGTPGAGKIRVTVFYRQFVAPSS